MSVSYPLDSLIDLLLQTLTDHTDVFNALLSESFYVISQIATKSFPLANY